MIRIISILVNWCTRPPHAPPNLKKALLTSCLKTLEQNIQNALLFLRKTYLKSFFYRQKLPWYLIAGAENSGKTTLLVRSGLSVVSTNNKPIQQITPTLYCQWFFNPKAVFIEVSGSLMFPSKPDITTLTLWRKFIILLYRYRNRHPLDGLILCIDLLDFQDKSFRQRRQYTDILRHSIHNFAYYMPIYLIFTRCDRIQGFVEFFQHFNTQERDQSCGLSLPPLDQQNFFSYVEDEFNSFLTHLNMQIITCLQQERHLQKRIHIKNFPLQLEAKKRVIIQLSSQLHSSKNPLQGIYFTSAQQEGTTNDALSSLLETFNLPVSTQSTERKPQKNSFFIKNTLQKIIEHKNLHYPIKNSAIYHFLDTRTFYVVLSSLFLISLLLFISAYSYNRYIIKTVQTIVTDYQSQERNIPIAELNPLAWLNLLQKGKDTLADKMPALLPRFVFHQADYLKNQLNNLYNSNLNEIFIPRLQKILTTQLQKDIKAKLPELLNTLKIYLMLGGYAAKDNVFIDQWAHHYVSRSFPMHSEDSRYFLIHFQNWSNQKNVAIQTDAALIKQARNTLTNISPVDLVYLRLIQQYQAIKPADIMGTGQALYTTEYLNKIYYQDIPAMVVQTIQTDGWVLGENLPPPLLKTLIPQLTKEVQQSYITRYIQFWETQLANLSVPDFKDVQEAYVFAETINTSHSLMLTPLTIIKNNLQTVPPTEDTKKILLSIDKMQQMSNKNKLDKPTIIALHNFIQYLEPILQAKDIKKATFLATQKRMGSHESDAIDQLIIAADKAPTEQWRSWLIQLANHTWQMMLSQSQTYINLCWQTQVVLPYKNTIENRYPIFTDSTTDINLDEFSRFFEPDGIIDHFFKTYLAAFIDTHTLYWQWKQKNNLSIPIAQTTLEMLNRADLIRKMYFSNNGKTIGVKFAITPTNIELISDNLTLTINGHSIHYATDFRQSKNIIWPNEKSPDSSLVLQTPDGNKQTLYEEKGSWSLFKLFAHAKFFTAKNPRLYQLIFNNQTQRIIYEIVTENAINPFLPNILTTFRSPEKLSN